MTNQVYDDFIKFLDIHWFKIQFGTSLIIWAMTNIVFVTNVIAQDHKSQPAYNIQINDFFLYEFKISL
jgi:hypothetical protein